MKNLIWGCTQMIVGMLGIIASQIAFILGINGWFFSGFSACAFIAFVVFAAMVVIGYVNRVRPELVKLKKEGEEE